MGMNYQQLDLIPEKILINILQRMDQALLLMLIQLPTVYSFSLHLPNGTEVT